MGKKRKVKSINKKKKNNKIFSSLKNKKIKGKGPRLDYEKIRNKIQEENVPFNIQEVIGNQQQTTGNRRENDIQTESSDCVSSQSIGGGCNEDLIHITDNICIKILKRDDGPYLQYTFPLSHINKGTSDTFDFHNFLGEWTKNEKINAVIEQVIQKYKTDISENTGMEQSNSLGSETDMENRVKALEQKVSPRTGAPASGTATDTPRQTEGPVAGPGAGTDATKTAPVTPEAGTDATKTAPVTPEAGPEEAGTDATTTAPVTPAPVTPEPVKASSVGQVQLIPTPADATRVQVPGAPAAASDAPPAQETTASDAPPAQETTAPVTPAPAVGTEAASDAAPVTPAPVTQAPVAQTATQAAEQTAVKAAKGAWHNSLYGRVADKLLPDGTLNTVVDTVADVARQR